MASKSKPPKISATAKLNFNGSSSSSSDPPTPLSRNESFNNEEDKLVESLSSTCYAEFQNSPELLGPLMDSLRENLKPGICLICIEDIERKEAIWSCGKCYCSLHLVCIQRWAKDSITNAKEVAKSRGFEVPIIWCCPKCRGENKETDFPFQYRCYCGKITNPTDDPWNVPHSCGDVCNKQLDGCEHLCSLLCHSGSCPKCPKQINSTCFCGQSEPRTLRCYAKKWSCGQVCSKELPCGFHNCSSVCHEGPCPKCEIPITLKCKCSDPTDVTIGCADLASKSIPVSCGSDCQKILDCGIHRCKQKCHQGQCLTCVQSCPCGKMKVECSGRSTTGWEKSCGETCFKLLECGTHQCHQKCHGGSCGMCLELVTRKCKCEAYEKEVLCSKEFLCTTRCGKIKNCGVHACNKKCCGGDCEPCAKECGKTLNCKNHKCQSECGHSGPCFPCPSTSMVKCRCGVTMIRVPCGSERKVRPPSCHNLCMLKTKCEHNKIQNHRCHFGDCPKCILPCGKPLPCGHSCIAKCHTNKLHKKPCPPCVQFVPTKHTYIHVPCHLQDQPCQELCGKYLSCNSHKCLKKCHLRLTENCGECRESCGKERPAGCDHQCDLGCHNGPCPNCSLVAKVQCHCEAETLFVTCWKQEQLSEAEGSCKNQCSRKLSCGHRCLLICHSDPCPETERCRRKVKLSCKCKKLKKELDCYQVETKVLECSEPTCSITPKQTTSTRPRSRKKKTAIEESLPENNEELVLNLQNEKDKENSPILLSFKALGIIGVLGLILVILVVINGGTEHENL